MTKEIFFFCVFLFFIEGSGLAEGPSGCQRAEEMRPSSDGGRENRGGRGEFAEGPSGCQRAEEMRPSSGKGEGILSRKQKGQE
jgi:hypothetical protein